MDCIREVWSHNIDEKLLEIDRCLYRFPIISFDTEFPGCLRNTPKSASEAERYRDMKYNVEETKLIQFGVTLSDAAGNIGGTWEVNFSDFGESWDARDEEAIEFLRRNGLDLEKIRAQGVGMYRFFSRFFRVLEDHFIVAWVTFHGLYDLAYLMKLLKRKEFPETAEKFSSTVGEIFRTVYDLKYMAGRCQGLGDQLGLEKLGRKLGLKRSGSAHHAGSDSLQTALAFARMNQEYEGVAQICKGLLYGISSRAACPEPIKYVPDSDDRRVSLDGYYAYSALPYCYLGACNRMPMYVSLSQPGWGYSFAM